MSNNFFFTISQLSVDILIFKFSFFYQFGWWWLLSWNLIFQKKPLDIEISAIGNDSRKLTILNVSSMFGWGCPGYLYFSKLISNTIGSHYLKSCIFVISKHDLKHHQVIFNSILIIFSYINIKWLIVFLYFYWILVWLSMMTKAFSRKFKLKFTFFNLIVVKFIFFSIKYN